MDPEAQEGTGAAASGQLRPAFAGIRAKAGELAVQTSLIVLAVLLALGVEEWREERQMRAYAASAREAVEVELERNRQEFGRTMSGLVDAHTHLRGHLEALRGDPSIASDAISLELSFPQISTAAWQVAQVSRATHYFDHAWMIECARRYNELARYQVVRDRVLAHLGTVAGLDASGDPTAPLRGMQLLSGDLYVLVQMHRSVLAR